MTQNKNSAITGIALLKHIKLKYLLPIADAYMPKQNTLPVCDEIDSATNFHKERYALAQPMNKGESYRLCANGLNILNKVKQMELNEELSLGRGLYTWLFQKLKKCLKETDTKR